MAMVNDVLRKIAYDCAYYNLNFTQTLEYERDKCEEWGIPYNRHVKRRLDALKRQIMNEWER